MSQLEPSPSPRGVFTPGAFIMFAALDGAMAIAAELSSPTSSAFRRSVVSQVEDCPPGWGWGKQSAIVVLLCRADVVTWHGTRYISNLNFKAD